ncbi:type IX secretion system periplasmic lipoprotein PorW/SprE [Flavitalea flava]
MTSSKKLLFAGLSFFYLTVSGQVGVVYDLKKPAKFENRTLASEKSTNGKKFKTPRRFIQNTVTHYNYYYNANNKLNEVVSLAKQQFRDDYTRLLPFYNYTLEATLAQKKELDSVIFKCTIGILIHDTRNDWIDNLYMLIGKSFYYRKDFDSAYITFQFLNYAFAPKEKDGYDKPIGSNANEDDGGNANIVSTLEKRNVLKKAFSMPPNRNESLIWKIRTYLARDQYAEASSLIEILKKDPQFPPRLSHDLAEVQALSFYKQSVYDSAAIYLEKALPLADGKEEEARWEYLIAQLYERMNNPYEAKLFYERTIRHTINPVMEVYARLNAIRQTKDGSEDMIQKNIEALAKMARKDRYDGYRDIIYYTAAQMELERKNKPGAVTFLTLCTRASAGNIGNNLRNKAFLQLANLSFEDKRYRLARNYYDSLNLNERDPTPMGDLSWLPDRRAGLALIVTQLLILDRQDSLQRIAALSPDQRDAYIKKLVKILRKQQGLKEDDQPGNQTGPVAFGNNSKAPPDLFNTNGAASADWYFYNPSLKSRGYTDFKTKWGNRPNVDNWQLSSLVSPQQAIAKDAQRTLPGKLDQGDASGKPDGSKQGEISYKSLLNNLPLTPEKMKQSSDSVEHALFILGKSYQEGVSDYESAADTYEKLLQKFPETALREETLLNLYFCYKKMGDEVNANKILGMLKGNYPKGKFAAMAINPDSTVAANGSLKVNSTHQYEKIYNSFIEGRFDEALAEKKLADSLYGDKYWTPQLLYIEAVYFIRSRQDDQAKQTLAGIQMKFPKTPMAAKAANLLDVLNRRKQIEDYLTKLEVKRATDDDTAMVSTAPVPAPVTPGLKRLVRNDSNMLVREDTSQLARSKLHLPSAGRDQGVSPAASLPGMEKMQIDPANLTKIKMDAGQLALLQKQADSLQVAMMKASADSAQSAILKQKSDSVKAVMQKLRADTAQMAARIRAMNSVFSFTPEKTHSVVIVIEKVDPVYVTETRNAFNRYNLENYYGQSLTIDNLVLSDTLKLVVISHFENEAAAMEYLKKAKASAPREIVPWLPTNKYSFLIISEPNLDVLGRNKDMGAYRKFLSTAYPGKF